MHWGRLRLRRWRWSRRGITSPALRDCWTKPPPRPSTPVNDVRFLVCDAEMSGLDPRSAELLSLGWVRIEQAEILLHSARHELIRNESSVGQSATVHQLRDCELQAGGSLELTLDRFLHDARNTVLVFHNADLDMAFMNRGTKAVLGGPVLMPVVDTLRLEHRLMQRRNQTIMPGDLRLQACRDRYGLLPHAAHNALSDAVATAELLLAHIRHRGDNLTLRDLL